MKTIELKKGQLKNGSEDSFENFIQIALETMPEGGFTFKDFKERDRIEGAMKFKLQIVTDDNGTEFRSFSLEDYDATILKRLVNSIKWAMRDPFITEFMDYIEKNC